MMLSELIAQRPDLDCDMGEVTEETYIANVFAICREVLLEEDADALVLGASAGTTGIIQYGMVTTTKLDLEILMEQGHRSNG